MKYLREYQQWRNHDLRYNLKWLKRHPIWENLQPCDEDKVWLYIENHYLDKYRMLFQVDCDWGSTGIWEIASPASTATGACYPNDILGSPPDVVSELEAWVNFHDQNACPECEKDDFDYTTFGAWGLSIAKKIKWCAPNDIYLEFHVFQELVKVDDGVIELDVPEYIQKLTGYRSLQTWIAEHPDEE